MIGIKIARIKKGMKQKELANLLGINHLMIGRYESGHTKPSIDNLIKMADILGVSVDYLVKGE
jgi:transcriptional regulator with XRE-family HTH domain